MIEAVNEKNLNEYESFISQHPRGIMMFSNKWARVKKDWAWEAIICKDENGVIKGSASALIRYIPVVKYALVYCCRGFCCDVDDFNTFDELFEGMKQVAKKHKGYVIKFDPEISIEEKDFAQHIESLGFKKLGGGANFENVQPNFVYCLDIGGKTEDEVFANFTSKTRYNTRLSERKGVTVKICGKDMLPDFCRIMKETGDRDGFTTRPQSYFERIMDCLGDDCRLYMAFLEDKPIAGTIAICFSQTMKYQYGASSNEYRNVMPNNQLQWEMIKWGVESGCSIYDFGGISGDLEDESNPLYGLYRFKRGFNGYVEEFVGEYDYVINPLVYKGFNLANKIRKKL